ncbi:MAG: CinA family protein [Burkholderiaceae bacterium]
MWTTKPLTAPQMSIATWTESELQENLHSLAATLGQSLAERGLMVRTAESCTGGAIARALTEMSGSSAWFDCAYVTYSNDAKMRMLGVDPLILEQHGAVSEAVALAMALGALNGPGRAGAIDNSIQYLSTAVTGVAGPGGGSPDKPVGTVWFGWAGPASGGLKARAAMVKFDGDRSAVRLQTAIYALQQIQTFWL